MPETLTTSAGTSASSRTTTTATIASVATHLPEAEMDNSRIVEQLEVDERWVRTRTGIETRRVAAESDTVVSLAAEAGRKALAAAGVEASDLDLVIVATFTHEEVLPGAAPQVAGALGATRAGAYDVGSACTGFLSCLQIGAAQIESGRARYVLAIGSETCTRMLDYTDRGTAPLFGDGAGAALLAAAADGDPGEIGRIELFCDDSESECIAVSHSDRFIRMRGQDTFRAAVECLSGSTADLLEREGLTVADIDLFVFHQANARITKAVGQRLGLPEERVVDCISCFGNTSAATLPIALATAERHGNLCHGDRVLLSAFGAGFTWGAGVARWSGAVAQP